MLCFLKKYDNKIERKNERAHKRARVHVGVWIKGKNLKYSTSTLCYFLNKFVVVNSVEMFREREIPCKFGRGRKAEKDVPRLRNSFIFAKHPQRTEPPPVPSFSHVTFVTESCRSCTVTRDTYN